MSSVQSLLISAKKISPVDRYTLAKALLETLRTPIGSLKPTEVPKTKTKTKDTASAKPKRSPTAWNKACATIRAAIKDMKCYKARDVMEFASDLKDANPSVWASMDPVKIAEEYSMWDYEAYDDDYTIDLDDK